MGLTKKIQLSFLLSFLFVCKTKAFSACPGYLWAADLPKSFLEANSENIKLFTADKKGRFKELAFQLDRLSSEGILKEKKTSSPLKNLSSYDRLTMQPEKFARKSKSGPLPCGEKNFLILKNTQGGYAYLAFCKKQAAIKKLLSYPVRRQKASPIVESEFFSYRHKSDHLLLFDSIKIKDGGIWRQVAKEADMLLHLDVKNFFTFHLDYHNMSATLEKKHQGLMGITHNLAFYIHLLFFTIDLKLSTLFSFFKDTAHAPMKFDIPVNAKKRLHVGSGILLHWMPAEAKPLYKSKHFTTPLADPDSILKGANINAKVGLKNCIGDTCLFKSYFAVGAKKFMIATKVAKDYVKLGFFPQFVLDIPRFIKKMDWLSDPFDIRPDIDKRLGIFFHNANLPKGRHQIDHWFYVAEDPKMECPQKIKIIYKT